MSWQLASFTKNPLTGDYIYSLLCDSPSDLPAAITGTDYDGSITQGCTAKCISDGSEYIANSSGTWVLQPSASMTINLPDVYSESEVDALLAPMQADIDATNSVLPDLVDDVKNYLILTDVDPQTSNRVTITYNGDGTYTVDSGGQTASDDGYFYLARSAQNPVFTKGTVISGCTGGSDSTYYISIAGTSVRQYNDAITLSSDTSGSLLFTFKSGQIFDNMVIKPMVCLTKNWNISQTFEPHYLKLVQTSLQVNLSSLTWTRSASGLYYSSTVSVAGITRVYSVSKSGFANLRETDVIEPICRRSGSWSGIAILANTNSFVSGAWITVSCLGEI